MGEMFIIKVHLKKVHNNYQKITLKTRNMESVDTTMLCAESKNQNATHTMISAETVKYKKGTGGARGGGGICLFKCCFHDVRLSL